MRLQDYAISDSIAEMRHQFSGLEHSQPDQIRVPSLRMSESPLHGIPKINHELRRTPGIDVRGKDALHLLAQGFGQGLRIWVRGGLNRQDVQQRQGRFIV